ncbi:MAG: ribose-phosphate diphosphokinase, partial [Chloroflexi bacterium]|nr:ribose-phosphate diphosphokinase [Chloroflexota bacterium]
FKNRDVGNDIVVVATDAGDAKRARNMAQRLDAPLAIVEKVRLGNQERVESTTLIGDVRDKSAIIVDDEIGTGGTVIATANTIRSRGARDIYCYAAHPVLSGEAARVLENSIIKELVVTDSLPIPAEKMGKKTSLISVAPLLGEAIQRIHSGTSVGAMFNGGSA